MQRSRQIIAAADLEDRARGQGMEFTLRYALAHLVEGIAPGAAISGCSARHWMARPASGPIQVIHGVRRGHVPLAREGASQGGAGSHGSGRGSSPPPSRPGPDP